MYQLVEKCQILGRSFFALLGCFFTYFCVEKHIGLQKFFRIDWHDTRQLFVFEWYDILKRNTHVCFDSNFGMMGELIKTT